MKCSHCGSKLIKDANFCFDCGWEIKKNKRIKNSQQKMNPYIEYTGYLSVGGWISIIAGIIVGLIFFKKSGDLYGGSSGEMVGMGLLIVISSILYAWFYFGLHKVILKINRIELALGIAESETADTKKRDVIKGDNKSNNSHAKNKKQNSQHDLPWELKEGD